MQDDNTMTPTDAANLLFSMSNAAPANKQQHMRCEQAKAILDVALKRLQEFAKGFNKTAKPKGGK